MALKEFIGILAVVLLFLSPVIVILWEEGVFSRLRKLFMKKRVEHRVEHSKPESMEEHREESRGVESTSEPKPQDVENKEEPKENKGYQ